MTNVNLSNYNVFITPTGSMYLIPVDETVEEFSEIHIICDLKYDLTKVFDTIKNLKPEYRDMNLSYEDLLINLLGYVLYSPYNDDEIKVPDIDINNRKITEEQIEVLNNLINNKPKKLVFDNSKKVC